HGFHLCGGTAEQGGGLRSRGMEIRASGYAARRCGNGSAWRGGDGSRTNWTQHGRHRKAGVRSSRFYGHRDHVGRTSDAKVRLPELSSWSSAAGIQDSLRGHPTVFYGIADQVGRAAQVELFHEVLLMEFDRLYRDEQ